MERASCNGAMLSAAWRMLCLLGFGGNGLVDALPRCLQSLMRWSLCMQTCSPLVSFMLYFCLWHSVRHILCVASSTFDALRYVSLP